MDELELMDFENPFINYEKVINNLEFNKTADGKNSIDQKDRLSPEMCAFLRQTLLDLRNVTATVGGEILKIGIKIIEFIFKAIKMYPNTACGLLIIACLHGVASSIPFFGHILDGLLVPFDVIIAVSTFVKDFIGSETFKKMLAGLEKIAASAAVL